MTRLVCPICEGIGFVFPGRKTSKCPRCGGAGSILEKPITLPRIAIVGEAWGEEEARVQVPFVGASGQELNRMLEEAGLSRSDCFLTNVFNLRPQPTNDIKNLCGVRERGIPGLPALSKGQYPLAQYEPELHRLYEELTQLSPNVIIALGNTPLWALTGATGITKLRGTAVEGYNQLTKGGPRWKVIPTFHPAAILRDWSNRPIVIADLMKAARQSAFPEVRRPAREIWIEPSIMDIERFYNQHWLPAEAGGFDIETAGSTQITCVGFSPSPSLSLVIPFVDNRQLNGSYWPTLHQERLAWIWVRRFLEHIDNPTIRLIGQNTLYDINWLWTLLGIRPRNYAGDTMLKHHVLYPELKKSLAFLGSIYTDEPAWKLMRGKDFGSMKRGDME